LGRFHCVALAAVAGICVVSAAFAEPGVHDWTGFYIGGNVGSLTERASGTSDFLDPLASVGFTSTPQNNSISQTHIIGGVQAGYNWQFNPHWVIGVESDWDWTHTGHDFCRQTDSLSVACTDNGFGFENISSTTDWIATVRGRLGFTAGKFMLYGTGGFALGRIDTTLLQSCLAAGCGSSSLQGATTLTNTATKAGWVAGLGVEYALDANWSARAEWQHIDLGTVSNSLTVIGAVGFPVSVPAPQTTTWSRTERYDQLRVGFNYRFR